MVVDDALNDRKAESGAAVPRRIKRFERGFQCGGGEAPASIADLALDPRSAVERFGRRADPGRLPRWATGRGRVLDPAARAICPHPLLRGSWRGPRVSRHAGGDPGSHTAPSAFRRAASAAVCRSQPKRRRMTGQPLITPDTKVGALLDAYPELAAQGRFTGKDCCN